MELERTIPPKTKTAPANLFDWATPSRSKDKQEYTGSAAGESNIPMQSPPPTHPRMSAAFTRFNYEKEIAAKKHDDPQQVLHAGKIRQKLDEVNERAVSINRPYLSNMESSRMREAQKGLRALWTPSIIYPGMVPDDPPPYRPQVKSLQQTARKSGMDHDTLIYEAKGMTFNDPADALIEAQSYAAILVHNGIEFDILTPKVGDHGEVGLKLAVKAPKLATANSGKDRVIQHERVRQQDKAGEPSLREQIDKVRRHGDEKPVPLKIGASVGLGQANRPRDVMETKFALGMTGHYPEIESKTPNGEVDHSLLNGLRTFQRHHALRQDGFANPGGPTVKMMNEQLRQMADNAKEGNWVNEAVGLTLGSRKLEAGLIGVGHGMTDTARGFLQLLGKVLPDTMQSQDFKNKLKGYAEDERLIDALKADPELGTAATVGGVVGAVAEPLGAVLPVTKGKAMKEMVKAGAKMGAAMGFLGYADESKGQTRLGNAALGAVTGGMGTALTAGVINVFRRVGGKELIPIEKAGYGDFGPIHHDLRGKPREAMARLTRDKDGEVPGALTHPELGEIDLVWGREGTPKQNPLNAYRDGYGLAKIAKKHPEVLRDLPDIMNTMRVHVNDGRTARLESEKHLAAVRLDWNDKRKKWLVTAYEKGLLQ